MRSFGPFLHVILTCALALAMFACGGGGSGSSSGPSGDPANMVVLILSNPSSPTAATLWVAAQDGQGPWKVLTGVVTGSSTIQFKSQVNDPGGRFGIAILVQQPMGDGTYYRYGVLEHFTLAEVRKLDFSPWMPVTTTNVMGHLSGLAPTDGVRITTGSYSKDVYPGNTATLLRTPVGTTDFIAARLPGLGAADSLVVYRGFSVPATGLTDITFNFDNGWNLIPQTATVSNADVSETLSFKAEWLMPSMSIKLASGGTSPFQFNGVPENRMLPGEFHAVSVSAFDGISPSWREATSYSLSGANTALQLPGVLAPMTFAAANLGSYYRPSATWAAVPGAMVHEFLWSDLDGTPGDVVEWEIHLSSGWLGNPNTHSFTFPDFNGVDGWNSAWGLPFGRDLYWILNECQTSYVDPGFYPNGPRFYKPGNTAWVSSTSGRVNATPGAAPLKRNASPGKPTPRLSSGFRGGGRAVHTRFN